LQNSLLDVGLVVVVVFLLGLVATLVRFAQWRGRLAHALVRNSAVAKTDHGDIEFADVGTGTPLLMLHGTPGGYDQVLSLVNATGLNERGVRAIIPSRPGYLRTPIASGATPEDQARLYEALLRELGLAQVFVFGVSGGGPSALQFAALYPERCLGLILEEAVTQKIVETPLTLPSVLVDFLIYFFRHSSAKKLKRSGIIDPVQLTLAAEAGETVALFAKRNIGQRNDLTHFATMGRIPFEAISCPTLILHGSLDEEVPISHAELALANIANSQLERIQGANHAMPGTHHKELDRLIRAFVKIHSHDSPPLIYSSRVTDLITPN